MWKCGSSLKRLGLRPVTICSNRQKASAISHVLRSDIPQIYHHIRDQNRSNIQRLKIKYDALLHRAMMGGGKKGIENHVKRNKKLLIRDRIRLLLDENEPTLELSALAGLDLEYGDVPCAGVVTMIGKVNGIWCMIVANDATIKGGTIFPITLKKQLRAQEIAKENRLPTIYLVDSGGGFLPLQAQIFNEGGKCFYNEAVMSAAAIPQAAIVCGSCTAGGAYVPAMAEESVILHKTGTIFLGGPPLVFAATGERITSEELGGATLHCKVSGCTDHFAQTEEDAIITMRDIVATMNQQEEINEDTYEEPLCDVSLLNDLAPCKMNGYQLDGRHMLACVLDGSRFHEFKKYYGPTLITGFGLVKGKLAGFAVSNGRITESTALKGSHFTQLCSQRKIPMVFLQNFSQDSTHPPVHTLEQSSKLIKAQCQLMQAIACSTSPSITITTGGICGSLESHSLGSLAMGSRFHFVYPNVRVGGYSPEYMADTMQNTKDKQHDYLEQFMTETDSFHAAARIRNDGVILPFDTRDIINKCLRIFKQNNEISVTDLQKTLRM
uniref:probable methylcrotonoyl-CoA carboxylase beta chain, mitochondrial n=1 Tax=Ciona intestinalis TaxID=7719 RepID=UPI0000523A4B|nr:probable methylcrotonoyl-CoA carboxylase beta chain, mitochondrial [Ciona intestinalis]|eukprot:XP_002120696.1 probable methylcrotonoyl-CoA carboxylase beta chain, mitochondrial [Ciona intestinalis]